MSKSEINRQQGLEEIMLLLAHDLRSPLNSMLGLTDMLYKNYSTLDREKKYKYVECIWQIVNKTNWLLEDLLFWLLSEDYGVEANFQMLSLKELISRQVKISFALCGEQEKEVQIDVPADLSVVSDLNMLSAIIRNLLNNIVKYSEQESVVKIVASKHCNLLDIYITDSGTEITPPVIGNFNPEYGFDSLACKNGRVHGLGMIFCKGFIKKLNGELFMRSKKGEGTEFNIVLPIIDEPVSCRGRVSSPDR